MPEGMRDASRPLVLVVDDEEDIRHALCESLEASLGCVVLTAASGPEALRLMRAATPGTLDLIVSDLRMAPMDGPTFLREAARTHPDVPRILMTAYPEGLAEATKDLGLVVTLTKPFDVQALQDVAGRVLAARSAAR